MPCQRADNVMGREKGKEGRKEDCLEGGIIMRRL